ncbi:MAG TPA: phage major capsid protein [Noviherbaspirillum sp.]|nr:phage major capsid protein [Noviherbaspirillum sp.]
MVNINDLRRERAQINTRVQAIAAMEAPAEADIAEFSGLKAKFDALTDQIERAEAAEKIAAASAVPVEAFSPAAEPKVSVPAQPKSADDKKLHLSVFTGMINALDQAQGNRNVARELVQKMKFPDQVKTEIVGAFDQSIDMAMNTESSGSGGVLIPTALAQNVIGYLFPNSVVQNTNGGPLQIDMPNGNLDLGRISGAPVASYTGRNAAVSVTSASTDKVSLKSKKLTGLIPIAKDLMRMAGIQSGVDAVVTNVMGRAMSTAQDIAMIRGDGTGNNIKGLRTWAPGDNVISATDIASLSTTTGALQQAIKNDLGKVKLGLRRANVGMTRCAWLMHPDTAQYLEDLQTSTGARVFPEMQDGLLGKIPVGITTQIPTNLTAGPATGNGSEIYLVDWDHWLLGQSLPLEVAISYEASYTDPGSGNTFNAFERDETLVRMIVENDIAPMHAVAVAVLNGVTWYR